MKFAAVVGEFNPFHNGHAYLLEKARDISGCDTVLCVMSGNFVQRAFPAIADMRVRAHAALLNGADAIIELPALYATACSERFAEAAVNIINSIPAVSHLVFGSESGELSYLQKIAETQAFESEKFKLILKQFLNNGIPYAAAYAKATEAESGETPPNKPNDILAVEYIKQLLKTNSRVIPVAVKRTGADYHDPKFQGHFSSATAVRGFLAHGNDAAAIESMPKTAAVLFQDATASFPVITKNFDLLVINALRTNDYAGCPDAGEGLEIKLKKTALKSTVLDQVIAEAKSKRYTEARIRRLCLQVLFNITHYPMLNFFIPAKLIGVRNELKDSILSNLPQNITVQNKNISQYIATLAPAQQQEAHYIQSINQLAALLFPLLQNRDGKFYESEPLLTV